MEPHDLVGQYIADQTGLPADIIAQLDTTVVDTRRRQTFAIWRDVLNGVSSNPRSFPEYQYMLKSLATPLQNRARQYRDYLSLSFAWYERAATAEYLSDDPRFSVVAKAFHAARLDCLLEAALGAFDLELVIPAEEIQAWWWIGVVTDARSKLMLEVTWLSSWAHAWSVIAAGKISVGTAGHLVRLTLSYSTLRLVKSVLR